MGASVPGVHCKKHHSETLIIIFEERTNVRSDDGTRSTTPHNIAG